MASKAAEVGSGKARFQGFKSGYIGGGGAEGVAGENSTSSLKVVWIPWILSMWAL